MKEACCAEAEMLSVSFRKSPGFENLDKVAG